MHQRGEGVALAMGTAIGGDGLRSVVLGGEGRRGRDTGESESVPGGAWRRGRDPGRAGKQEVAGAWPACGEHAPLPPGARRMTTGEASRLGRARWAGQHR